MLVRNLILGSFLSAVFSSALMAQASPEPSAEIRPESGPRRTIAIGVLGAANYGAFRVVGTHAYDQRIGGSAGIWANLPLGRFLSLESQLLYSRLSVQQSDSAAAPIFLDNATAVFLSFPLLLNLHLGPIALFAGGQLDVPFSMADDPNRWTNGDVTSVSFMATGGLTLFPRSSVSLFGRYHYGFTSLDNRPQPDPENEYFNQYVQAGLRIRAFGGTRRAPPAREAEMQPSIAARPARENIVSPQAAANVARPAETPPPPAVVELPPAPPVATTSPVAPVARDTIDRCRASLGADRPTDCPVLDSDGDGLTDRIDRCPTQPGSVQNVGCPIPDTDGDGLLDSVDRCPEAVGSPERLGCPEIPGFEPSAVTFRYGRATLSAAGRRELDKVVEFMQRFPDATVLLEGHTDNSSSDVTNQPLSEERAFAAGEYLVTRGIPASRIRTSGVGSSKPTVSNATAAGRALNRRVEVIVR